MRAWQQQEGQGRKSEDATYFASKLFQRNGPAFGIFHFKGVEAADFGLQELQLQEEQGPRAQRHRQQDREQPRPGPRASQRLSRQGLHLGGSGGKAPRWRRGGAETRNPQPAA